MSAYELTENVSIVSGDTWNGIEYTITRTGTDYTGATVRAQFRRGLSQNVLLSKVITPDSAGLNQIILTIALTPDETTLFIDSKKIYTDIEITTSGGEVKTPILIVLSVQKDITR